MSLPPIQVLQASDDSLLGAEVTERVKALVGDGDASLIVTELSDTDWSAGEEPDITPLVDAAQTPPFLSDHRVVVGRHMGRFTRADSVAALVSYLENPLETTAVVAVWEKAPDQQRLGALPKTLKQAIDNAGGTVTKIGTPGGRELVSWIDEQAEQVGVRLRPAARQRLAEHLGEDVAQLLPVLASLRGAFGDALVGVDELEPYLGEAGARPPWELTDAIAEGNVQLALRRLGEMTGSGERHPLQIMATLHNHFEKMLRLDGTGAATEGEAASILGVKPFPAKKVLRHLDVIGHDGLTRCYGWLAQADLDLRGASGLDPVATTEILVARLAAVAKRS